MVILFDILSILLPAFALENSLETPGLKPFSTLCAKLRCPLFVQFSNKETLELLTVSLSYENLLPRLIFTCFCFVCETVQHVFVTITNVVDSLNHIFFLLSECHPLFNVWTATHVLQFSSGTVPLNFV